MRSTMRRGLSWSNCSGPRPHASSAPGRKFSMSTSASCASLRTISCACGSFRSSAIERLLRDWTCHHTDVPSLIIRQWRSGSPVPGGSTLITSAPKSPSVLAAKGPAINCPSSRTFSPSSGPATASGPLLRCGLLLARRLVVIGQPLVESLERILHGQQLVQVLDDRALDLVLEHAEQHSQARIEHELVLGHLQFAVAPGPREGDEVGRLALLVHAFHPHAL